MVKQKGKKYHNPTIKTARARFPSTSTHIIVRRRPTILPDQHPLSSPAKAHARSSPESHSPPSTHRAAQEAASPSNGTTASRHSRLIPQKQSKHDTTPRPPRAQHVPSSPTIRIRISFLPNRLANTLDRDIPMVGDGVVGLAPARAHGLGRGGGQEGGAWGRWKNSRGYRRRRQRRSTRRIKGVSAGAASLPARAGTADRDRRVATDAAGRRWG